MADIPSSVLAAMIEDLEDKVAAGSGLGIQAYMDLYTTQGDVTIANGETVSLVRDEAEGMVVRRYNSLTIEQGGTLTIDDEYGGLVLLVEGDLTIGGTIDLEGKGFPGTPPMRDEWLPRRLTIGPTVEFLGETRQPQSHYLIVWQTYGAAGGVGGSGCSGCSAGDGSPGAAGSNGAAGSGGGGGGSVGHATQGGARTGDVGASSTPWGGRGGRGGNGNDSVGGAGGPGGGALIAIVLGDVVLTGTAAILQNGLDGQPGVSGSGPYPSGSGGGGPGGGAVVLYAGNLTDDGVDIQQAAGLGNPTRVAGGNGSAGAGADGGVGSYHFERINP